MTRTVRWLLVGLGVAGLTVLIATVALQPNRQLTVTVADVGQGDAIVVAFPSGQRWLIDGGPDDTILETLDRRSLVRRPLTGVVLTHPHADHVTGLINVLERYQVGRVLMPSVTHTTPEYLAWLEALRKRDVTTSVVDHPFVWTGQDNGVPWRWEFLYPTRRYDEPVDDLNAVSVVSRLTFGEQRFLFMGDATAEVEGLLAEGRDLSADVLKVGHHGSDTSTGDRFLAAVQPSFAIISVGADNRYRHPSPVVLKRLGDAEAAIYRTDFHGNVTFRTDGSSLSIETERQRK